MIYKTDKPIFLQIADHISERILQGVWKAEDRIPSVRELSIQLVVNPRTATKAVNFLEERNIIFQRRGLGYFVSEDGLQRVRELYKTEFLNEDLPNLFRKMQLLDISIKVVVDRHAECCC
jgi:DNA-binding transcriptional regulator YhcF (GntR family)